MFMDGSKFAIIYHRNFKHISYAQISEVFNFAGTSKSSKGKFLETFSTCLIKILRGVSIHWTDYWTHIKFDQSPFPTTKSD